MNQFKLKRKLIYGMHGEDVRLMQKLLNFTNDTNSFYNGRIPENGSFDMFRTRVCLSKFQTWCDIENNYIYDLDTHGMLLTAVNTILESCHAPSSQMYSK